MQNIVSCNFKYCPYSIIKMWLVCRYLLMHMHLSQNQFYLLDVIEVSLFFPHPFAAAIENPYNREFNLFRNPRERNSGKLVSLSDFLNLTKNSSSLAGVLISVEVSSTIT